MKTGVFNSYRGNNKQTNLRI